jgi:beta-mannosidase
MKTGSLIIAILCVITQLAFSQSSEHKLIEIKDNWKMHKFGTNMWYNATVPGCVHTDLLANKLIPDPFFRDNELKVTWVDKCSWEYSTTINVDKETFDKQNIILNFKGIDTYADVYLNDQLVLTADNMFVEWKANIKKTVKEGSNKLRILFHSPIVMGLLLKDQYNIEAPLGFNLDFGQNIIAASGTSSDFPPVSPYTRKAAYMYGWDWAPKLTTSGIWRPVYLEAWDNSKINSVQVVQKEVNKQKAVVILIVEVESSAPRDATFEVSYKTGSTSKTVKPLNEKVSSGISTIPVEITIEKPLLWWPNGMGEHPVYEFNVSLSESGKTVDQFVTKAGLRTIKLVQEPDSIGKSFYFEVNGIPVFAKGANYVPADIFPSRVTPEHYQTLLKSAADANINMLRVWGGGIYESDLFYDLCDKLGIMIWQDFAFSTAQMPDNQSFLNSIRQEVTDNIIRLRNHPCIVLWCGNNETELLWNIFEKKLFGFEIDESVLPIISDVLKYIPLNPPPKETTDRVIKAYGDVFYNIIPEAIKKFDNDSRAYWPSSPCGGWQIPYNHTSGDMHYYIAYANARFEACYDVKSRFFSEHGFQSFPDFNTVKKFTNQGDWNFLSPVMQHHQRAMGGNQVLDKYMKMYYRYPKDFETYLYISQVMQAEVMKMSFETHRSSRPYTMGTLYWQLNDVWPVASWSGIDYLNHWKALHYQVKRSFSNVIIAPRYYKDDFKVFLVSDLLTPLKGTMELKITDFSGKELKKMSMPVYMEANTSKLLFDKISKDFLAGIDTAGTLCQVRFIQGKVGTASNIGFFAAFKNLNLPKVNIEKKITETPSGYTIELSSDKFAKSVYLSIDNEGFFSDNYFDLLPGEKRMITYTAEKKPADFVRDLKIISLVDSY